MNDNNTNVNTGGHSIFGNSIKRDEFNSKLYTSNSGQKEKQAISMFGSHKDRFVKSELHLDKHSVKPQPTLNSIKPSDKNVNNNNNDMYKQSINTNKSRYGNSNNAGPTLKIKSQSELSTNNTNNIRTSGSSIRSHLNNFEGLQKKMATELNFKKKDDTNTIKTSKNSSNRDNWNFVQQPPTTQGPASNFSAPMNQMMQPMMQPSNGITKVKNHELQ